MQYDEKIKRLKALNILRQIPERQIVALAEFLRPRELKDGEVVFQEGSTGLSLYFVSSGRLRITKAVAGGKTRDLAVLGPGEFFGEMALIDEATRTASTIAAGPCVIFELFRGDLGRWVKSNPAQAVQFFAELVHVQSMRLRRTSNELTLHFDLSSLLLDKGRSTNEFMAEVINRVVPHLDGSWSAAAYLQGAVPGEPQKVASVGGFSFDEIVRKIAPKEGETGAWFDSTTYYVSLIGQTRSFGHLLFHAQAAVGKEDQDDIGRALTTVSRLVATALEFRDLSDRCGVPPPAAPAA